MKASEVLQKALEGFGPEGQYWANFHGLGISPRDNARCCETAFNFFSVPDFGVRDEAIGLLMLVLGLESDPDSRYRSLNRWNDAPERTWPEVQSAFIRAIAVAEEEEKQ